MGTRDHYRYLCGDYSFVRFHWDSRPTPQATLTVQEGARTVPKVENVINLILGTVEDFLTRVMLR